MLDPVSTAYSQIVSGILVNVIATSGRWLSRAAYSPRGRSKEMIETAQWFNTYKLTEASPDLPELPVGVTADSLTDALTSDELQANLHELLAVRLTDAPERDVAYVRSSFTAALFAQLPGTDMTPLANVLFDYYDDEICTLVGRLEGMAPTVLSQIRSEAFCARIVAVLGAIQRHAASSTARVDAESEERFLNSYRRHVVDLHGKLQPPDFERRQRIAIADLYVAPTIVHLISPASARAASSTAAMRRQGSGAVADLQNVRGQQVTFSSFADSIDRSVLLGDPGGGKSTASNVLMHLHATDPKRRVPFLVILREFAAQGIPSRSVVGHIEHKLETLYQCPAPPNLVAQLLLSGRAFIVFDGLDELIDPARRLEITEIVEQFCLEYPLAPVLVTSRLVGYDYARLDDRQFERYQISEFNDEQIAEYARKWFLQDESLTTAEAETWASSFLQESSRVPDLRSNPLMLALMCILYHGEGFIPRNRPEVYEQCADLLFRRWDARRQINVELRARHLIEPALRHLAYWLFTRNVVEPAVSERELISETTVFLYERGFESKEEAESAAAEFISFCKGRAWVFSDAGTTASGEVLFTFTHRTFLEYFAAAYVAIMNDTPEKLATVLAPHVAKQEWEVVAELAVQKKEQMSNRGAERVLTALLSERRRRSAHGRSNILQFLGSCIGALDLPPRLVREVTRVILDFFFSGASDDRDRFTPISSLLSVSGESRDLIREELSERIKQLVGSADIVERASGLRLAIYIDAGVNFGLRATDSSEAAFWGTVARENRTTYMEAMKEAAKSDPGMVYVNMFDGGGVAGALELWNDDLTNFFLGPPLGIFAATWTPYIPYLIRMLVDKWPSCPDNVMRDLADIGAFLVARPDPPWVVIRAPVSLIPFLEKNHDAPKAFVVTPEIYACVYIGLLICFELDASDIVNVIRTYFPELEDYVSARMSLDVEERDREPARLGVPSELQQVLIDWAAGRISFTALMGRPEAVLVVSEKFRAMRK